jgi:hypothetical protein
VRTIAGSATIRRLVEDSDGAGIEIEVRPGKAEDLALAQATAEREQIQGLEAIPRDRTEEHPGLLGGEGMNLSARNPGRKCQTRHVAPDELGPLGVSEGLPHVPQVRHRPGRETTRGLGIEERLHISRAEIDERMQPQAGDEVKADHASIADERLGSDREAYDIAQPVLEVYPEQDGGRGFSRSCRGRSPSGEGGGSDHRRARLRCRVCMSAF